MQIRRIKVERFRAIDTSVLHPGPVTVLIGPSNSGKSTVLAAMDLLLHHGLGRPRVISELDFYVSASGGEADSSAGSPCTGANGVPQPATCRCLKPVPVGLSGPDSGRVAMQLDESPAGVDWALEMHIGCVVSDDGAVFDRFDCEGLI